MKDIAWVELHYISDFSDFNYERIAFEISCLKDEDKRALKEKLHQDYINHLNRMDKANYFAIWNCDFQDFVLTDDIYFDDIIENHYYILARLHHIDGTWFYSKEAELEIEKKLWM